CRTIRRLSRSLTEPSPITLHLSRYHTTPDRPMSCRRLCDSHDPANAPLLLPDGRGPLLHPPQALEIELEGLFVAGGLGLEDRGGEVVHLAEAEAAPLAGRGQVGHGCGGFGPGGGWGGA